MEQVHPVLWTLLSLVLTLGSCITVSSNGNTPQRKMLSIDAKDIEFGGFVPINPMLHYQPQLKTYHNPNKNYLNSTVLPVNERYRRLIPYMTFYLANDFNNPQNDIYASKVPLQKVAIPVNNMQRPQNSKVLTTQYSNVPHYQGNRLSNFNIASAFPNRIIQDYYPNLQQSFKYTSNQNPLLTDEKFTPIQSIMRAPPKQIHQNIYDFQRPIPVPVKIPNVFNTGEIPTLQFYSNPIDAPQQKYKLVPYEQTPPVQVPELTFNEDYFVPKPYIQSNEGKQPIPIPVSTSPTTNTLPNYDHIQQNNDQFLINPEQKYHNNIYKYSLPPQIDNLSNIVHETNDAADYQSVKKYVLKKPAQNIYPTTETGFKPMIQSSLSTPSIPTKYTHITPTPYSHIISKPNYISITTRKPIYHYKTPTTKRPNIYTTESSDYDDGQSNINYGPSSGDQFEQNNLAKILQSLQNSNSLPQTITADNIDSSIKTLVKILNNLKSNQNHVGSSTISPDLTSSLPLKPTQKPITNAHSNIVAPQYKQPLKTVSLTKPAVSPLPVHEYPPQDLEIEHVVESVPFNVGNGQSFHADEYEHGGTPGRLGVDYPALSSIPHTSFDCKTQRYKGFFGDPETNCQVWHYCDLNGGQASFLCPNGTIFSQVALTCDWWFNVKCSTTTQLYVLNERLYKYILPYSPKFPEDYSGPLVDKYLAIKYKEMEEKMKKKKKVLKPEAMLETEKAEVIEIKTSGMSGALRPYEN